MTTASGTAPVPPLRPARWRWLLLPALAVSLATAGESAFRAWRTPPAAEAPWGPAGFGPRTFAEAVARADSDVDQARDHVTRTPGQWLPMESLARALIARARLDPGYGRLAEAVALLDRAQAAAPPRAGPLLTAAVAGMMVHRLDRTDRALAEFLRAAVPPEGADLAEAEGLSGDVAFYRGDMAAAETAYRAAARSGGGAGAAWRLAVLARSRGQFLRAAALLRESEAGSRLPAPYAHAMTALQMGALGLARGDYPAAARWFERADRTFPGDPLIAAHRAQSRALAGDVAGATEDLRRIARRYPAPELFDALAMMLRSAGRGAEARAAAAQAAAGWNLRLALLPEAAWAHAAEHELVFGDPARALDFAQRNLAARPYGEARVLLASVLLARGAPEQALAQLAQAERSGWRSAPLYALRTRALELLGREDAAAGARTAALALNPRIFAPETALVWLSHG